MHITFGTLQKLIQDMERAIYKRETISTKGRANTSKKAPEMTEAGLRKACAELKRSILETEKEAGASDARVQQLDGQRAKLGEELEQVSDTANELKNEESTLHQEVQASNRLRVEASLATGVAQRQAKRLGDLSSGMYQPAADEAERQAELRAGLEQKDMLQNVVQALVEEAPDLKDNFMKSMALLKVE